MMLTPSPCVSACSLGLGDFCQGCQRSLGDVSSWSAMSEPERASASARARARRSWRDLDGRLRAVMTIGPRGEAGLGGGLPWSLPSELAWFKQATAGMALATGRSTWEGLGRALPGRLLVAIGSSEPTGMAESEPGSTWAASLDAARGVAFDASRPLCVTGDPSLWRSCWGSVDLAWITRVEGPMSDEAGFDPDLSDFERVAEGPRGVEGGWRWEAALWERWGERRAS